MFADLFSSITDACVTLHHGWLWVFLKIYIRAFQHASDIDESIEEKLLIGDRPKQSVDPERKLPLKERLAQRKPEELIEVMSFNAPLHSHHST